MPLSRLWAGRHRTKRWRHDTSPTRYSISLARIGIAPNCRRSRGAPSPSATASAKRRTVTPMPEQRLTIRGAPEVPATAAARAAKSAMERWKQAPRTLTGAVYAKKTSNNGIYAALAGGFDHAQGTGHLARGIGLLGLQRVTLTQRAALAEARIFKGTADVNERTCPRPPRQVDEGKRELRIGETGGLRVSLAGINAIGRRIENPIITGRGISFGDTVRMPAVEPCHMNVLERRGATGRHD